MMSQRAQRVRDWASQAAMRFDLLIFPPSKHMRSNTELVWTGSREQTEADAVLIRT